MTSSGHSQLQNCCGVLDVDNERKEFSVLLKNYRKIINEEEKSKTVDLSGMRSRMCMLSFVTVRCVLAKP